MTIDNAAGQAVFRAKEVPPAAAAPKLTDDEDWQRVYQEDLRQQQADCRERGGRWDARSFQTLCGRLATIYGQPMRDPIPRSPWDPRAVSDPRIVVGEFPGELLEAGGVPREHPSRPSHRSARTDYLEAVMTASPRRRAALVDALEAELAELAADTPAPALPGAPPPRGRSLGRFPTSDQDQRAIAEVHRLFRDVFARGLRFVDRRL